MTTKKESGYVIPTVALDDRGLTCDSCYFFNDDKCSIVKGFIDEKATCNLWSRTNSLSLHFLSGKDVLLKLKKGKVTKIEAGYTDARKTKAVRPFVEGKGIRCGSCVSFIPSNDNKPNDNKPNGCKGVAGDINKYACCNLWSDVEGSKIDYMSGKDIKNKLRDIIDIEDIVMK